LGIDREGKTKEEYDTEEYRKLCKKLLKPIIKYLQEYRKDNYKKFILIGIENSPTCDIFKNRGILMEELLKEIEKLNNGVWCNQVSDFIKQVIRPKTSKKIILIGNSLGSLVALTCAVYLENEILSVIASPLPDPLVIKKKESKLNSIFEKCKTKLTKIFFRVFPLEIVPF